MRNHRSLAFVFLVAGILVLVACAQAVAPATAPSGEGSAPAAEAGAASSEPVTIQLWSNAWFPSSIAGRQALVDKFNEEYQGKIQVEYVQGDWGQAETYVQSGAAAGGGIACIVEFEADGGAQNWYRKGWISDLGPYITDERRALTTEDQWKAREYPDDGAIVANATILGDPILTVLYNPAHLEAAGIEPATVEEPWSWEEFYENARLLTLDANGKHLGEDGFDPAQVQQWGFLPRLDPEKVWEWGLNFTQQRMGKPVIREEGGRWGWYLDEEGAQVYERVLTPVLEGIAPDLAIGISGDSLHQAFADGMASMIIRETFGIPIIHDNYPDFDFAAMPTPSETGDKVFYRAGGEGMVMTKNCEHPEEAAEFIFWVMQPENLAGYAYSNGMLPGNYAALDVEPFKSDPTWDIIRDYLARGEVYITPFNPNMTEFRDTIVAPMLMEVVEGKRTFAEANELLKEQADIVLNQ
jgi:ABC-type glycerol-3-phosphate transport system substrate-binding protein